MFDFVNRAAGNILNVVEDTLDFNIDGDKVKQLVEDGLTIYEIAALYSVSTDLIEEILKD